MSVWEAVKKYLGEHLRLEELLKALLVVLLILLVDLIFSSYAGFFAKVWQVILPFIIGMIIAFVIEPLFAELQKIGIPRWASIILFWAVISAAVYLLMINLIPSLSERIGQLFLSIVNGINYLGTKITENGGAAQWYDYLSQGIISQLKNLESWLPDLSTLIPDIIAKALDMTTSLLIIIVISIYMMAGYPKLKQKLYRILGTLRPSLPIYFSGVADEVGVYFRTMFIVMIIRYIEYCLVYFLIGNGEWSTLALITAVSVIVPYIGPTIANLVGLVTSLTLPPQNVLILFVIIMILSNIDNYVVSPLIHSRRSYIDPLWTLFAVFLGGSLAGAYGVIFAVPIYLGIRSLIQTYAYRHPQPADNDSPR